jgi:hypothetical protein
VRRKRDGGAIVAVSFEMFQWVGDGAMASPLNILARRDVVLSAAMVFVGCWQRELAVRSGGAVYDRMRSSSESLPDAE